MQSFKDFLNESNKKTILVSEFEKQLKKQNIDYDIEYNNFSSSYIIRFGNDNMYKAVGNHTLEIYHLDDFVIQISDATTKSFENLFKELKKYGDLK